MFDNNELIKLANKYNPYQSLRPTQERAIIDIIQYFNPDATETIIVELPVPTAGGKTLINTIVQKILAYEYGEDMVLGTTPLIELVKQYANNKNYSDVPTLLGKNNYKCKLYDMTADNCTLQKDIKKHKYHHECNQCPYKIAKNKFDNSPIGWRTFDGYLRMQRDVSCLIIDESASIESKLRNYYDIELPNNVDLKNLKEFLENWTIELEENLINLEGYADIFIDDLPDSLKQYTGVNKNINKISKQLENIKQAIYFIDNEIEYIIEDKIKSVFNKEKGAYEDITVKSFKLLTAHIPFAQMLHNLKFIVLSSATPATKLLTNKEINRINTIHPIPKEQRPIFFMPVGSMSYNSRNETSKIMAPVIANLHNKYGGSTMLHAGSYVIAELIYNELVKYLPTEDILKQTKQNRNLIIKDFYEMDKKILISVEYNEGIDLCGDKYPLNIIAKLPAEPWTAKYTVARNMYDKNKYGFNLWYNTQSANKLMQSYGRICRTPQDEGTTFVLDKAVYSFWNRNKKTLFYNWFNEAVQIIKC